MGYKKLSKDKYKITIELGYDVLGNRRRKTQIFNGTAEEVVIKEAELIKQFYHKDDIPTKEDITFEQFSKIYINYCKAHQSKRTVKEKEVLLKRILPVIGKIKLKKITTPMLNAMYLKLRKGLKVEFLNPATLLEYYKLINVMFNYAIEVENLLPSGSNPNSNKLRPKIKKTKRRFYNIQQTLKFIACLRHECIKYHALLLMAIEIGARCGEIVALRWSDIDWDAKTIYIDNSLAIIDGIVDEEDAKTDDSVRDHSLSNELIAVLREYKEWQDIQISKMGKKWMGTDRVFTQLNGKHMHPHTPLKILQKVQAKYSLPITTFHEIRHTSASIKLYKGIDPKAVSELQGSGLKVLLEIYDHVFDDAKKKSASIFDDLINESKDIKPNLQIS